MRRIVVGGLAGTLVMALAGLPATAQSEWEPSPGGWTNGPVEWVTTVPVDVGTAIDAVLHDGYLYVTSWRGFSIYDIGNPAAPDLVRTVPSAPHAVNENPQTNGEILLLSNDTLALDPRLDIWDVRDKTTPTLVSSFPYAQADHLWTCLQDCAYAYSSHGKILDLTDPADPKDVGRWLSAIPGPMPQFFHHIAEVGPARVMVGAATMYLLDTTDPTAPVLLADALPERRPVKADYVIVRGYSPSVPARVDWPLDAGDDFVLVTTESPFSGSCDDNSGSFFTYDARNWEPDEDSEVPNELVLVDEYQITENGIYSDGNAAVNYLGCTAYGFEAAPGYAEERLVAVSWFEHGVRFLGVDDEGEISDIGGFVPAAGNSTAVRWASDEIVYVIDFHRGIDVLRLDRS